MPYTASPAGYWSEIARLIRVGAGGSASAVNGTIAGYLAESVDALGGDSVGNPLGDLKVLVGQVRTATGLSAGTYNESWTGLTAELARLLNGGDAVAADGEAGWLASIVASLTATGGVIGTPADTTPNVFSFTDVTDADIATVYTHAAFTVAGIDAPAAISITGGQYQIEGGGWTSTSGTVADGEDVEVRGTSSGDYETAVNVVLTIGGVSDTFTITTGEEAPAGVVITNFNTTPVNLNNTSPSWTNTVVTPLTAVGIYDPVRVETTNFASGNIGWGLDKQDRAFIADEVITVQVIYEDEGHGATVTFHYGGGSAHFHCNDLSAGTPEWNVPNGTMSLHSQSKDGNVVTVNINHTVQNSDLEITFGPVTGDSPQSVILYGRQVVEGSEPLAWQDD